ncbi:MAG: hypothetical protein SFY32_17375 [Bacteroidota bacterium]|nr:hypothetical protein [Bacteroidota bacterium]
MIPWAEATNVWAEILNVWAEKLNLWAEIMNLWAEKLNLWAIATNIWAEILNLWAVATNVWAEIFKLWVDIWNPWAEIIKLSSQIILSTAASNNHSAHVNRLYPRAANIIRIAMNILHNIFPVQSGLSTWHFYFSLIGLPHSSLCPHRAMNGNLLCLEERPTAREYYQKIIINSQFYLMKRI